MVTLHYLHNGMRVAKKEDGTFSLGSELEVTFEETGISQEALAAELKVATNTISRWETGVYEPTLNDLERLSRLFGVSITQFFPQVEERDGKSQKVDALLRAAQALHHDDLDELQRYAEFRRARSLQKSPKRKVKP